MNEDILAKVAASEVGKVVSNKLFGWLEKKLKNKREEQEACMVLNAISVTHRDNIRNKFIDKYLFFKTISSGDRAVFIDEIYVPNSISRVSYSKERVFRLSEELNRNKITCISGRAGQGKTTMIRNAIWKMINDENNCTFPLMITLRKINWKENLQLAEIVREELFSLNINLDTDTCEYMLKKNLVSIFFDGFDEVAPNRQQAALNVILSCYIRYGNRCCVATRPGASILNESLVTGYKINDLSFFKIKKIVSNYFWLESGSKYFLLEAIKNSDTIQRILSTPVLVDIFAFVYPELSEEPKSLFDFYKRIFELVVSKHDRLKVAFKRESLTAITNEELEELFKALCFKIIIDTKYEGINREYFENLVKEANKITIDSQSDTYDIAEDLVSRCCLIIQEGDEVDFAHKSIVEYYAANFISMLDEESKFKFYNLLLGKYINHLEINNVIYYLSYIDKAYFSKMYLLPYFEKLYLGDEFEMIDEVFVMGMICGYDKVKIVVDSGRVLNAEVYRNDKYFLLSRLLLELQAGIDLTEVPVNEYLLHSRDLADELNTIDYGGIYDDGTHILTAYELYTGIDCNDELAVEIYDAKEALTEYLKSLRKQAEVHALTLERKNKFLESLFKRV